VTYPSKFLYHFAGFSLSCREELRDLYASPSIIRIMKARRMRWVGHVARMWEKRNAYRLLVGKPEVGQEVGGWIILGWIL
jgi:hypothetical protein